MKLNRQQTDQNALVTRTQDGMIKTQQDFLIMF